MLNKEKHQLLMGRILKDIYSDTSISPLLGFKGGTCAYFFYNLPRFSVDLNFDFLGSTETEQKIIFDKILNILKQYGEVKDSYLKRFTIFALLSYGDTDHNIKIEINIREKAININDYYELKEYLGISMLAAKKDYLFAGKLAALTLRKELATRDIYDIYYFAKNNWDISTEALMAITGKSVKEQLSDCLAVIEKIKPSQTLAGLGELISEKEKNWVKNSLCAETIFLLKDYQSVIK
jgi:predicted nucleotidyltransferase component of viral defense system